jgi:hypothetical protein
VSISFRERLEGSNKGLANFKNSGLIFPEFDTFTLPHMRIYKDTEGKLYPSVTTTLKDISKEHLDAWRAAVGHVEADRVGHVARSRGTRLHTICDRFLANDPQYMLGAMPEELELFYKVRPVLCYHITKVHACEFPLRSKVLKVAGRVDAYVDWADVPTVTDFKSSTRIKTAEEILGYFYQGDAYALMLIEAGFPVKEVRIVIGTPFGVQVFKNEVFGQYTKKAIAYFEHWHKTHQSSQEFLQNEIETHLNKKPVKLVVDSSQK